MNIRLMTSDDLDAVSAIYNDHVGSPPPPERWRRIAEQLAGQDPSTAAVVATGDDGPIIGYAIGEVRSWEFGSDRAGWIYALGVAPQHRRGKVAQQLMSEVVAVFREMGINSVRTMVHREDVPVLRLFRSVGFVAGPYAQLELSLTP